MTYSAIWITGEPAVGKTTLAHALFKRLPASVLFDGDEVRKTITRHCGFDAAGRRENQLTVARHARVAAAQGKLPIVALVSPMRDVRAEALQILGGDVLVIALEAPESVRRARALAADRPIDPQKAFPYESVLTPTILIDTSLPPAPIDLACTIVERLLQPRAAPLQHWAFLHHRCASIWWRNLLAALNADYRVHRGWSSHGQLPPARQDVADLATWEVAWDGNARYETMADLDALYGPCWRGIHVYRDPRDLLVSAYMSHRYSHPLETLPGLEKHRPRLESLSFAEGLLADLDFYITKLNIETILDWPAHPQVLPIPYEQMFRDERSVRIWSNLALRWLGIAPRLAEEYLAAHTFEGLSGGRKRGQPDSFSHYHRGQPGAWWEVATSTLADTFMGRYGGRLVRLGYGEGA